LLGESLLLCSAAGGIGVALSWGISRALRNAAGNSPALGPLASFAVTPRVIVLGSILALGVGLVSGIVPAWGAARRRVATAMREAF
jgi:ABC-type antimicrobial peptide transport system permease subunit